MPKIETWDNLPVAVRRHIIERMRDRSISIADLNQLRLWIESKPAVPDGDWYKDFGTFKICGRGPYPSPSMNSGRLNGIIEPTTIGRSAMSAFVLEISD
jgi:hypothetical protein